MKTVFIFGFIFTCNLLFAQKRYVREQLWELKNVKDAYSEISHYKPDTNKVDFFRIDTARIQAIFESGILKLIRKNDTIKTSTILTSFAKIKCNYFLKRKYKVKKAKKINSKLEKALPYLNIKFGLLYSTSFTFSISPSRKVPYYDDKDGRSEFHLYERLKNKKELSKPLSMLSEIELKNLIINELSKEKSIRENGMRNFSYVGYSFYFVKQKKDKIPRIRVVFYFGGKRLKLVKV